MDIRLDTLVGDLPFTNSLADIVTDKPTEIQQRLYIRLKTFLGEWYLNTNYGVPYFQQILGKNKKKATVDAIIQSEVLEDTDVLELVEFNSQLTPDRVYSVNFKVKLSNTVGVVPVTIQVEI